jgi:hypothetical protein
MSVLLFLESSRWERPEGGEEYFATYAGAAIEEVAYGDFCRRLLRLKEKFFKVSGVAQYELRGRHLLNARALATGYRKVEFVRELFSLCRLQKVASFAVTKQFSSGQGKIPGLDVPLPMVGGAIVESDQSHPRAISILLAYLVERANSYMLETHPGAQAKLIFKTQEPKQDFLLYSGVMNFFFRTPFGGGFHGILGSPFLMPAALSPGLQVADIFAYTVNQHHAGRRDLGDVYAEIEDMQYISSMERDEYQLRGMNLLE